MELTTKEQRHYVHVDLPHQLLICELVLYREDNRSLHIVYVGLSRVFFGVLAISRPVLEGIADLVPHLIRKLGQDGWYGL